MPSSITQVAAVAMLVRRSVTGTPGSTSPRWLRFGRMRRARPQGERSTAVHCRRSGGRPAQSHAHVSWSKGRLNMPEKETWRGRRRTAQGKKPTTAAGEFVRERWSHPRGKARRALTKQAIAIGLSKPAAGVPLKRRARDRQRREREAQPGAPMRSGKGGESAGGRARRSRASAPR